MLDRDTLVLLRFPFSFFLLPTFLFGLGSARGIDPFRALVVFAVLHLCLYPASNSFNSYYDRDEGPIGGLAKPPKPTKRLLAWSLGLDAAGIALSFLVSPWLALCAFVYGCFSKLYSWDRIRLKRFALASWLCVTITQGGLIFLMVAVFCGKALPSIDAKLLSGAAAAWIFMASGYPMTQIYQHEEDARRGDRTISMILGIRGTFILSIALFLAAGTAFALHYALFRGETLKALVFLGSQAPFLAWFVSWMVSSFREPASADHRGVARMNFFSSLLLNCCFALLLFM